jgi:hypothetical protein
LPMNDDTKPAGVAEIVKRHAIDAINATSLRPDELGDIEPFFTRACEEAVKSYASRLKAVLKERSKGEYATWGFVAMFMDMIDEEMKCTTTKK